MSDQFHSINRHLLSELYRDLLKREPDEAGISGYLSRVVSGSLTLEDVRKDILGSEEYKDLHHTPEPTPAPEPTPPPAPTEILHGRFLDNGCKFTTHGYLSHMLSDDDCDAIIKYIKDTGGNTLDFYIANDGDYENVGLRIPVRYSLDVEPVWLRRLKKAEAAGLHLNAWMMSDDRFSFFDRSDEGQVRGYWDRVIRGVLKKVNVERLVLGLEIREYLPDDKIVSLGQWLKNRCPDKKICFHTIKGDTALLGQPWVDEIFFQYSFEHTPERVIADTKHLLNVFQKPVIAAEYCMNSNSALGVALGNAAISAGASGALNGSRKVVNVVPPVLPYFDSIDRVFTDYADNSWVPTQVISPSASDVANWPRTISLSAVRVNKGGKISFDFKKDTPWQSVDIGSGPSIANVWVLQKVGGKVVASTLDYLRPNAPTKDYPGVFVHAGEKLIPPFSFRSGETYGIMITTLARNNFRTTNERSNIIIFKP